MALFVSTTHQINIREPRFCFLSEAEGLPGEARVSPMATKAIEIAQVHGRPKRFIASLERSRLRRVGLRPCRIGIKQADAFGEKFRFFAKILLKDRAGVIDYKGHDARVAVFGGVGDQCETADHLAFDDVIKCASRRIGSLPPQYSKKVSMVRVALPIHPVAL